ncbi:MAG TPA: hypothetical protein PKW33_14595 [Anaerolineaceae bacterium]|nr:hypothetical protein [Anaerolineaceae bacterium]HPN52819.1 hypothetical protein [Anaerolineaceae bacterium]
MEIAFLLSQLFIILVGFTAALLAIFAKVDIFNVVMRTAVALLSAGAIAWVINWLLGQFILEKILAEEKEKLEKAAEARRKEKEEALRRAEEIKAAVEGLNSSELSDLEALLDREDMMKEGRMDNTV